MYYVGGGGRSLVAGSIKFSTFKSIFVLEISLHVNRRLKYHLFVSKLRELSNIGVYNMNYHQLSKHASKLISQLPCPKENFMSKLSC